MRPLRVYVQMRPPSAPSTATAIAASNAPLYAGVLSISLMVPCWLIFPFSFGAPSLERPVADVASLARHAIAISRKPVDPGDQGFAHPSLSLGRLQRL